MTCQYLLVVNRNCKLATLVISIFLHSCAIKSRSSLGTRLGDLYIHTTLPYWYDYKPRLNKQFGYAQRIITANSHEYFMNDQLPISPKKASLDVVQNQPLTVQDMF